jgi:hypothetical protein
LITFGGIAVNEFQFASEAGCRNQLLKDSWAVDGPIVIQQIWYKHAKAIMYTVKETMIPESQFGGENRSESHQLAANVSTKVTRHALGWTERTLIDHSFPEGKFD